MTTEEIQAGNKAIAEFLEYPKCDRCDDCGFYRVNGILFSPEQMAYHTSWDWLMPSCSKCNDIIQSQVRPSINHCNDLDWLECEITIALREYKIDMVYQALIKFIEAYNKKQLNHHTP